jgi:hypothetical protein
VEDVNELVKAIDTLNIILGAGFLSMALGFLSLWFGLASISNALKNKS